LRAWVVRLVGSALVVLGVLVALDVVRLVLATIDDGQSQQTWSLTSGGIVVAVVALAAGVSAWIVTGRASSGWPMTLLAAAGAAVVFVGLAVAALAWRPTAENAEVIAYERTSGDVLWRATLPTTWVGSITEEADVIVVRSPGEDGCPSHEDAVEVQLDPGSGERLGVDENPPRPDGSHTYLVADTARELPPGSFRPGTELREELRVEPTSTSSGPGSYVVRSDNGWSVDVGPTPMVPVLASEGTVVVPFAGHLPYECQG
jgi:hypothetical protein